jgi:hypothetical protein
MTPAGFSDARIGQHALFNWTHSSAPRAPPSMPNLWTLLIWVREQVRLHQPSW